MFSLTKLVSTPTEQLGKASRFLVFQIKLWTHCARLLKTNRSGQQAAALAYNTIFGLVPLFIVFLMVFQLFPAYSEIGDKVKEFIYDQAGFTKFESAAIQPVDSNAQVSVVDSNTPESIKLTEHIDRFSEQFFKATNKGSITIISVVIVIWAALALLSTIERAFNNIWHVSKGRNFLQRMINYWALLTLGPLVLGAGIYLATKSSQLGKLQQTFLNTATPLVVSYFVTVIVFFLLYFVLPNTKVKVKPAIWGSAVAALVWISARNIFTLYVSVAKPYSTIYGVLALIPITVMWIYITWLIVLFGLQLTFATQHLESLDAAEIAASRKREDYFIANETTAINVVREIVSAFEKSKSPLAEEIIFQKLNIPTEFGSKILNSLVSNNIILKVTEPKVGFVPAKEPLDMKLGDIAEVVTRVSFGQAINDQPQLMKDIAQSQRQILDRYNIKQII